MDDEMMTAFDTCFDAYIHVISVADPEDYVAKRPRLRLPVLPLPVLLSLVEHAKNIFISEPNIVKMSIPVVVIGDLHGHLLDLFRILKEVGCPPMSRFLFLGDLIDRGEFSTETLILVLLMKVLFPKDVTLVRGNHEFMHACVDHSDFFGELYMLYTDDTVKDVIMDMFTYMPFAADVDNYALVVHGGIGPSLWTTAELVDVQRPIVEFEPKVVEEILWSDPSDLDPEMGPSCRGLGRTFGVNAVHRFIERSPYHVIVRGHQCVMAGVQASLGGQVVTVFSASNYCGDSGNMAGVLEISRGPSHTEHTWDPLPYMKRYDATYVSLEKIKESLQSYSSSQKLSAGRRKANSAVCRSHGDMPMLAKGKPRLVKPPGKPVRAWVGSFSKLRTLTH